MFCYKCGAQLPDDAIFCIKCGTRMPMNNVEQVGEENSAMILNTDVSQIGSQTDLLTDDGNTMYLEGLLEKKWGSGQQNKDGDLISFEINGELYKYDKFNEKAFILFKKIAQHANKQQVSFVNMYEEKVTDTIGMWEIAVPYLVSEIENGYKYAMQILNEYSISDIDEDELYAFVENQCSDDEDENCDHIQKSLSLFVNRVEYLTDKAIEDEELRRIHRDHNPKGVWVGGGFGIKGALKGAITASALNMAGDAIRGLSYRIEDNTANSKIREKIKELYIDGRIYRLFYESVEKFYLSDLFPKIAMILSDKEIITWTPYLLDRYGFERIKDYPFAVEDYRIIYTELSSASEKKAILDMAEYFGIKQIVLKYVSKNDSELARDIYSSDKLSKEEKIIQIESIQKVNPEIDVTGYISKLKEELDSQNKTQNVIENYNRYMQNSHSIPELLKNADEGDLAAQYYIMLRVLYSPNKLYSDEIEKQKDSSDTAHLAYSLFFIRKHGERESDPEYKAAVAYWEYVKTMALSGNYSAMGIFGYCRSIMHYFDTNSGNIKEGYHFFKKAAPYYEPLSCTYLGKAYINGEYNVVERDVEKAKELLKIGAAFGVFDAKQSLENANNSSCYITSAVCKSFNKPDDCYELTMFRSFRDNWLCNQNDGKVIIKKYYETAPLIVQNIDGMIDSQFEYKRIWDEYLSVCLKLLESKRYEDCKLKYIEMVDSLTKRFL